MKTLPQLMNKMGWSLTKIDSELKKGNIEIVRRGGELKFRFREDVVSNVSDTTRYEPAKHLAKHVSRKSI